jgi:hypothetical protein
MGLNELKVALKERWTLVLLIIISGGVLLIDRYYMNRDHEIDHRMYQDNPFKYETAEYCRKLLYIIAMINMGYFVYVYLEPWLKQLKERVERLKRGGRRVRFE